MSATLWAGVLVWAGFNVGIVKIDGIIEQLVGSDVKKVRGFDRKRQRRELPPVLYFAADSDEL